MSRETIFADVSKERDRQDNLHPQLPKYFLHPVTDPLPSQFKVSFGYQQKDNDEAESKGEHSWYGIMNEEEAEVFSAETIEELDTELVQSIALRVRLLEALRNGLVTINSKQ